MMNDWWNDPPEAPDPPECPECEDGFADPESYEERDGKAFLTCDTCGHKWEVPILEDPGPEDFCSPDLDEDIDFFRPYPAKCPHGREWGECGDCDHASDLAYDAAREARVFGGR